MRYFAYLAYNGANYSGWQIQPNGESVQETLEKAFSTILRTPIEVTGAGRTDSGVHARQMVAHLDAEIPDVVQLTDKMNRFLPKDISIFKIIPVKDEAHARFDAVSRLYRYYMTDRKDPFYYPFQYRIHEKMNLEMMNKCADILFEYTDFTSFSKLHTDVKTNNCTIMHARWEKVNNGYIFTIKADRFLRNMVRAIVGTLYEAGRGRLDERGMRRIIEAKNRAVAGNSVPGNALFLEEIEYPESLFL